MDFVIAVIATIVGSVASANAIAAAQMITPSEICPGATIVNFETGITFPLPTVVGLTFVRSGTPNQPNWFDGSAQFVSAPPFGGPFGGQVYANFVSATYSDLAVQLSPPVEAIGAYIGAIPSFTNQNPTQLTIRALDAAGNVILTTTSQLPQLGSAAPSFVGVSYAPGIAQFEWRGENTGFFGVDNVTFGMSCAVAGAVAVPAIDTWWLLFLVFLVVVVGAWRVRRA